jgi:membrane protease YdiL (CAAX protease family)
MDPQHTDPADDQAPQRSIPTAKPAAGPRPDIGGGLIPTARPATGAPPTATPPQADQWWAPKPISRAAALGDILIVAAVLIAPQVGAALLGAGVHSSAEPPLPERTLAANSLVWASIAALVIYLTYRSGQPLSSIGFRWMSPAAAVALAILATLAIYVFLLATVVVVAGLTRASQETMTAPAREIYGMFGQPSWGVILGIAGTAAVFEEIVFRGFLLTRLRVLVGGWPAAIVIGSLLFAAPHVWEGRWAVALVLPVAAVLSIAFVLARGLAVPMVAHFLFNFLQLATIRAVQDLPQWQQIVHPERGAGGG